VAVVNIGAAMTSLAVFEEGDLMHVAVIPIGSDHITRDINLCFKTSLEVAERLKLKYGSASSKNISKKDEINLTEEDVSEEEAISRKALAEIIEARVEEIFAKVNAELKKVGRLGLLPAGAVLCGGGAKLDGIMEVAKKELRLPVSIGCPADITSISEKINDPAFGTAIGLVKLGSEAQGVSIEGVGATIKSFFVKIYDSIMKGVKSIWK
jgi:cell division protein FtsA